MSQRHTLRDGHTSPRRLWLIAALLLAPALLAACEEDEGELAVDATPEADLALEDVDPGDQVTIEAEVAEVIGDDALIIGGGFLQHEALVLLGDGASLPGDAATLEAGGGATVVVTGEVIPIEIPPLLDEFAPLDDADTEALEGYTNDHAIQATSVEWAPEENGELADPDEDEGDQLATPGPDETPVVPQLTEADVGQRQTYFVQVEQRLGERVYTVGDGTPLVVPGAIELPGEIAEGASIVVDAEVAPLTEEGLQAQYPEVFEGEEEGFLADYEGRIGLFALGLEVVEEGEE